ncbi:hypothetical protein BOX15_Mlig018931g1 [Macrostomum lignano]|uniref:Uncharacterized protein n=2 Tax=Macrostomum lignano TaxID=282301 RepID=A0A267GQM2_9PLAT|nr:hypothetical protein BOX15_Mlig018931g2 [Macrostomum lignano]PAA80156.1 hypothetical protein BOX15_Mlig018931g3 [Macrostomum lignano]PAA88303.1 hypothetical protein BOX15_Mlig018931g1 [Macrostomum lignano]
MAAPKKSGGAAEAETSVDLVNRDPNSINSHIRSNFDEVLGEQPHAHSIDCLWSNSYKCYNCGFACLYKTLTVLTGLCLGLYWGCQFAFLTYCHVWCMTPMLKFQTIDLNLVKRFNLLILDTCCGPLCETLGLVCSRIKVQNVQK